MKTVGMITIYRKNYGAFLQAYALQKTLMKLDYIPEIIRYDYYKDNAFLGVSLKSGCSKKQFLRKILVELVRFFSHRKRQKIFNESVKNNIKESKEYYRKYKDLLKNPPQYDIYLTGSDQVFNGTISPQALPARLLSFVKKGKKASYAASAGGADFEPSSLDFIISNLNSFDKVSVREQSLAETLLNKYKIDALCNIDPVFLLSKEEWRAFSKEVSCLKGEYIFFYRVLPQPELATIAQQISEKLNVPVFVADGHEQFGYQICFDGILSPEQWVYAINNAKIVVTNSFHGTAFAVNLNKNAYIMLPPKGGERVRNLLSNCGLEIEGNLTVVSSEKYKVYDKLVGYIESEKKKSFEFLNSIG